MKHLKILAALTVGFAGYHIVLKPIVAKVI